MFLKNILRLLKNDDVSMLAKRHYQVKKNICQLQSIYTQITTGEKKLYRQKRTLVIKQKVWRVRSPPGYLDEALDS